MAQAGDRVFVIEWEPGVAWVPGRPVIEQDLGGHRAYWERQSDKAKVTVAGPYLDAAAGGIAVFSAISLEEATAIMMADPAIDRQVFAGKVRPLFVVFPAGAVDRTASSHESRS
jgi:uncharacterized protein YciI